MKGTIQLATLCCFIVALLEDCVATDEIRNIRKKCTAFIPKGSATLNVIANEAWQLACTYPDQPEWDPRAVAYKLYFSQYNDELIEIGLRAEYFTKMAKRHKLGVRARFNSVKIAKFCIESINKTMYKHKELL
jgi:hypothetical protein